MAADEIWKQNRHEVGELPADSLGDLMGELDAVAAWSFHIAFDLAGMTTETSALSSDLKGRLFGVRRQRSLPPTL